MGADKKIEKWLDNLKLFSLNAEVHCSREEKAIEKELIGTRYVNLAFKGMIEHMHSDFDVHYEDIATENRVIEGGKQILLIMVGEAYYYTDISMIHEIVVYPAKRYNQFNVKENPTIMGILNWYEGLVPVIRTHELLDEASIDEKFMLITDIGKEIYALAVTEVYSKYEVEISEYGKDLVINERHFKYIDFQSYENTLRDIRMKIEI